MEIFVLLGFIFAVLYCGLRCLCDGAKPFSRPVATPLALAKHDLQYQVLENGDMVCRCRKCKIDAIDIDDRHTPCISRGEEG